MNFANVHHFSASAYSPPKPDLGCFGYRVSKGEQEAPFHSLDSGLPVSDTVIGWYPRAMRYAVWNNKGGVGKSFLSFVLGTEVAQQRPDEHVILVDMCPQANLSEIVLGGNGTGAKVLEALLGGQHRKTVGGYFDTRIASPHQLTGEESSILTTGKDLQRKLTT